MLETYTGLFYRNSEGSWCSEHEQSTNIDDVLAPYVGAMVHVILRHLPTAPIQPDAWGGGCCKWQPASCPFEHENHPNKLYAISPKGVLSRNETRWMVGDVALRFDWMDGHLGQLILFSPRPMESVDIESAIRSIEALRSTFELLKGELE